MAALSVEEQLLDFFRALAEPKRLKIIGILARQPYSVDELAAMLDLKASTVSHHLSHLAQAGLVSARAEGYYSIYQLETGALQRMAERLLAKETLPAIASDIDLDAYDAAVVHTFLDKSGHLKTLPGQEKKFKAVLRYAAQLFEKKRRYSEKEVNRILGRLHEDTASLRRGLIEFKLMKRDKGEYWLIETANQD